MINVLWNNKNWNNIIIDRILNVSALPEITVFHYILIFSGLRTSIREIYNNEGIAGFFR